VAARYALYGLAGCALMEYALAADHPGPLNDATRKGEATRAREAAALRTAERARLRADRESTPQVTCASAAPVSRRRVVDARQGRDHRRRARPRRGTGTIKGRWSETACEAGGEAPHSSQSASQCFVTKAAGLHVHGGDVLCSRLLVRGDGLHEGGRGRLVKEDRSPKRRALALLGLVRVLPPCAPGRCRRYCRRQRLAAQRALRKRRPRLTPMLQAGAGFQRRSASTRSQPCHRADAHLEGADTGRGWTRASVSSGIEAHNSSTPGAGPRTDMLPPAETQALPNILISVTVGLAPRSARRMVGQVLVYGNGGMMAARARVFGASNPPRMGGAAGRARL